jgi:hypothetical protein
MSRTQREFYIALLRGLELIVAALRHMLAEDKRERCEVTQLTIEDRIRV